MIMQQSSHFVEESHLKEGVHMAKPICPKCKSEDIKKGVMGASFGQVQMFPENIRGKSSPISAEYCNKCGYIIALYVEDPKNVG